MCYFLHRQFQVSTFNCEGGHYVLLPTLKVIGKQVQHGGGGGGMSSSCVSFHTKSSR